MMLFVRNRMTKTPKTQFLSGTYDMRVSWRVSGKNPIFLDDYPATSPIIPSDPARPV